MTTLTGTLTINGALVTGSLWLEISQQASAAGGVQVSPSAPSVFRLVNGAIAGPGAGPYTVYGNDVLTPAATFYRLTVFGADGGQLLRGNVSIAGASQDIGAWATASTQVWVPPTGYQIGLIGDANGPSTSNTVTKIQGKAVAAPPYTPGHVLTVQADQSLAPAAPVGLGGTVAGAGTPGRAAKWVGAVTLGDSLLVESGTVVSLGAGETLRLGGGTYALEGALHSSIRGATGNALEVILGSQATPDLTGNAALLVEKYLGADISVNAGHAVVFISKKVGGTGAADARSGGLNIEAIDKVGWGGAGAQSFCEGIHSKAIGAWPAGTKGSIQAGVFHAYLEPGSGANDFGFVNCCEITVTNRVKDAGARSWAVLNGAAPSWPADFSCVEHIFNYPDSTHPVDVLLCLGNGYGEQKAYNGLVIRSGAIQSGGYLIRTPYLTVADTGHVTVGPSSGGGDAGYALAVVEETAGTNDVVIMENLSRRTSGTAAAGLGLATRITLEDAGGAEQGAFQHNYEWINPAAGILAGKWTFYALDFTGAKAIFVAGSDGAQSILGFHGAGAVAQQAIGGVPGAATAGASYTAAEQAMLQAAYDGIRYVKAALNLCGLTKV